MIREDTETISRSGGASMARKENMARERTIKKVENTAVAIKE